MHLVATIDDSKGHSATIDQTSVVDEATTKIYTLIVTCTSDCYDAAQEPDRQRRQLVDREGSLRWTCL